MALQQFLYTSFIAAEFDAAWLHPLVRRARSNNRLLDVTGILMFDGLRFCQYLEGPLAPMRALLERIRLDPRHIQVQVKESSPLEATRRFPDSPMAFAKCANPTDLEAIYHFKPKSDASVMPLFQSLVAGLPLEKE